MNTRDLVYIALFAALTAALGLFPPLTIPVANVPITAQSLGVMLAGALAGSKRGGLALLLFIALVAAGMPLLAGGRGGFGIFLTTSGGFLLAWPIAAFVIGWLFEKHQGEPPIILAMVYLVIGGIGIVYLGGIPWMAQILEMSLGQATVSMVGFIPGDIVKVVLAALIGQGVRKAYPLS